MTRAAAPPGRINWKRYADGQRHILTQRVDFAQTTELVAAAARGYASRHGYRITVEKIDPRRVAVTFAERTDETVPDAPGSSCDHDWKWIERRGYSGRLFDLWQCSNTECRASLREPREIPT